MTVPVPRQTCCVCRRTVGTLPSGVFRPFTSERRVWGRVVKVWHTCTATSECEAHRIEHEMGGLRDQREKAMGL